MLDPSMNAFVENHVHIKLKLFYERFYKHDNVPPPRIPILKTVPCKIIHGFIVASGVGEKL